MKRDPQFYETAGYTAYRLGKTSFSCELKPGSPEMRSWMNGYARAKQERAKTFDGHARPVVQVQRPARQAKPKSRSKNANRYVEL